VTTVLIVESGNFLSSSNASPHFKTRGDQHYKMR
jgi:hypothetical protein